MQINNNNYSVAELLEMLDRRDLTVNRDYQRGQKLWPKGPSSYFIDTILETFPFPKIYIYEFLDPKTRKLKREIVDGQQRISTIQRFKNGDFSLSGETAYTGMRFADLPLEVQTEFLTYTVSVDVIRNATRTEILQMFRRMNAYTLPLNEAEKRHSRFQGEFKWFINNLADELNEFFVEFGVFSDKQIVRMADAALLTDLVLGINEGIISTSPSALTLLYKENDLHFDNAEYYEDCIKSAIDHISANFGELRGSHMMKPYALHTLVLALIHNRYGITKITDNFDVPVLGEFCDEVDSSLQALLEMAGEHEVKEMEGEWPLYVWGSISTTDRKARRTARIANQLRALGAIVPDEMDDDLA